MELEFRDRSNLGKRGWLERIISTMVVYALLNLEDEILLRGVEFVTPKNLIFN